MQPGVGREIVEKGTLGRRLVWVVIDMSQRSTSTSYQHGLVLYAEFEMKSSAGS